MIPTALEDLDNYLWPSVSYFHAIEMGNYRAAVRHAITGHRHDGGQQWVPRIRGAFTRRHRKPRGRRKP